MNNLNRMQCNALYQQVIADNDIEAQRQLCLTDVFFLLTVAFQRRDVDNNWLFARCREVEAKPDGMLDLWAREHYKSTIITYALSIQDILKDPDVTIGIFSHTKPIAKAFMSQIKIELEQNEYLKELFPEILYATPKKDSPKWSMESGIQVKRKSNAKEPTVSAFGLVDGQPTSKHFSLLVYDDVVTLESVSTPDQIEKTTAAWAMSLNLGAHGGRVRYIGTRYHFNDTYREIIARQSATSRVHTATVEGTFPGTPIFLSRKALAQKRRDMGPYVFGSQMLQNPVADAAMGFKVEWLNYVPECKPDQSWNVYVLCDPAGEKKKGSDYTVIVAIGLAPDGNYYLLDGIRDRINLTERTNKMFEMVERWSPKAVGYEKYGKDSDIEHIEYVQEQRNFRFVITPLGGPMAKNDRIRRLVPKFEDRRFWFPNRILFLDHESNMRDFIAELINDEYSAFPVGLHDDMMDCISRIDDIGAHFPKKKASSGYPGIKAKPAVANNKYKMFK